MTAAVGASHLVRSWPAHAHGICALAWSPSGEYLASGGNDSLVHVWHRGAAEPVATLAGHEGALRCLEWSPDGRSLVTGADDGCVVVWDWATREAIRRHRDHRRWINAVGWSPCGSRYTSASGDGTMIVYDTVTQKPIVWLRSPLSNFMSIAWSAEGSRLAAAARTNVVVVWRTSDWSVERRIAAGLGTVWSVAWAPRDGRLTTAGQDGRIQLWDLDARVPTEVIEGHTDTVARIVFSADGRWLASLSHDETIGIWSVPDGSLRDRIGGRYPGWIYCLAFHPCELAFATTDRNGRAVEIWGFDRNQAEPVVPPKTTGTQAEAPARAILYRSPPLAFIKDRILAEKAQGRLAVTTDVLCGELTRRHPNLYAQRAVRRAAMQLGADGQVILLDGGDRIFLPVERLAGLQAALTAIAQTSLPGDGAVRMNLVPDEVMASALPGGGVEWRSLVERALVHRLIDTEAGWFHVLDGEGIVHLPPAATAICPSPNVREAQTLRWRLREPHQGAARVAFTRLANTTLFTRLLLCRDAMLLEDSLGLRYVLARQPGDGSDQVVVRLTLELRDPGVRLAHQAAIVEFVARCLHHLGPTTVAAVGPDLMPATHSGISSYVRPSIDSTEPRPWWDPHAPEAWPLRPDELGDDVEAAVAAMTEQVDDERQRQTRLCALKQRAVEGRYDVMICHLPEDRARADALRRELEDVGLQAWVDFHAALAAPAPAARLLALAEATGVMAVLIGPAMTQPWSTHAFHPFYRTLVDERPASKPRLRWIPIRLPEGASSPQLPPFLHSFDHITWRDQPRAMRRTTLLSLIAAVQVDRARN